MPVRDARIDLRISEELKRASEWAAECEGQTLTRFVEEAVRRRIREVREERERTLLSERDREVFLAILDNEEPSDSLRKFARRYGDAIESGELHVGDRAVEDGAS